MAMALFLMQMSLIAGNLTQLEAKVVEGGTHLAAARFSQALESCRAGLRDLGSLYITPGVIDDSGYKLIAAEIQLKEGRLENAAVVTCRILKERLELWVQKQNKTLDQIER